MQYLKHRCRLLYSIMVCLGFFVTDGALGQQTPFLSNYHEKPILINPAYTGIRNSLAFDLSSRQQWIGVKGAPSSYYFSMHSPINDTKVAIGGYMFSDMAGPLIDSRIAATYSYLLRINHSMFISFGLNGGVDNHWLNLNQLDIINENDPHFAKNIENVFKPVAGAGLVLFTPSLFLGFSSPQILNSAITLPEAPTATTPWRQTWFLASGITRPLAFDYGVQFSTLSRFSGDKIVTHDLALRVSYQNLFTITAGYRTDKTLPFGLSFRVAEDLSIAYGYDHHMEGNINPFGRQEITITYDFRKLYLRNRDREFMRKKEEDVKMNSIRHFF